MIFGNIEKPKKFLFAGTFRNNSLFFFLGILISKQIAPTSLFSFPLRIKTPFCKNVTNKLINILVCTAKEISVKATLFSV
jgi:hypothetical protein